MTRNISATKSLGWLVALLLFVCCANTSYDTPDNFGQDKIHYIKDYRTDLCFAFVCTSVHGGNVVSITQVECTPVVLKFLPNTERPE